MGVMNTLAVLTSFFDHSLQMTTFATLLCVGLIYLVLSASIGAAFGGDSDSPDVDHPDVEGDFHGPAVGIFSPKVIAIFLVGFGAGGGVATNYDAGPLLATAAAIATGMGVGGIGVLLLRVFYKQQASSEIDKNDALGAIGTVTNEVPPGGAGEVTVSVKGQLMTYICRSPNNLVLHRGARVKIHRIEGPDMIVEAI